MLTQKTFITSKSACSLPGKFSLRQPTWIIWKSFSAWSQWKLMALVDTNSLKHGRSGASHEAKQRMALKKKRHSKSMMSWERKVLNVHSNLSFLEIKYKQELLVLFKNTVFYMKLQLVVGTFASRLLDVSRVILLSLLWQKNLSSWHGWPTDSQVITQQTTPLPDSTPQKKTNPQNLRILTPILEV